MITIKNISKTFPSGNGNGIKALQNVSLEIKKGEFVVVIGSNGSGKSTLLNAIAGNIAVDTGEIFFENKQVNPLKEHQRSKWIARVFQNPYLGTASDLTIIDNFRLASIRTKTKSLKRGINKLFIDEVKEKINMLGLGLENRTDQLMGTLSGGQRQALTLIMAVMDEAKILLMDEPTAALDPKTSEMLMQQANKIIYNFKLTSILVTHSIKDAHAFGSRIIQMQEGQVSRDIDSGQKQLLSLSEIYDWF